jgi:hypothetical protein
VANLLTPTTIVREAIYRSVPLDNLIFSLLLHRLLRHHLRCKVHTSGGAVRDLHAVLRQKEQDAERVRREIQALLTVVPLLADDEPHSEDLGLLMSLASARTVAEPYDNGMADLEKYYPFVKHMRLSKPK